MIDADTLRRLARIAEEQLAIKLYENDTSVRMPWVHTDERTRSHYRRLARELLSET